ncbi:MAG: hypothetical protein DWH79_13205 [Planctomycetota bacterium]|nr:MAG: hypothetical protein DWH79_13205 [Planctomycetota bacterium]
MTLVKRVILLAGVTAWLSFVLLSPPMALWRSAGVAATLAAFAAVGIVVAMAVALLERRFPGPEPDPVIVAVWSVVQGLCLAFLLLLAVGVLSAGMGAVPELVVAVLLAGTGAGFVHGWWMIRRLSAVARSRDTPTGGETIAGPSPRPARGIDLRPVWFTLGCASVFLLLIPVAFVANRWRGPVDGLTEIGTWRHVQDQRPVNRAMGAALALLGWSVGIGLGWRRASLAFVAGLVVAFSLLGFALALMPG